MKTFQVMLYLYFGQNYVMSTLSTYEYKFQQVVNQLEKDVVEFARLVGILYAARCKKETLESCEKNNNDNCLTKYENQTCEPYNNRRVSFCDEDESCSSLMDHTKSSVKVTGPNRNPTDPRTVEDICYSRLMDDWVIKKINKDKKLWRNLGPHPRDYFFGTPTGMLRIFPGRQSKYCGGFDSSIRPWYVSASSGPKNTILILDTSGSMYGPKLEYMKLGAKRIIQTLTLGDRIAVVLFNDSASAMGSKNLLLPATEENKKILLNELDKLRTSGATNFLKAFDLAFKIINDSIIEEAHAHCNTALLFLTDGEMTHPENIQDDDVIKLVANNITTLRQFTKYEVLLFSYSVSQDENVHVFPARLACATNGVWSKITDEEKIVESLSSYHKLFTLGVAKDIDKNFSSWVMPYRYATGSVLGTTVSAPVYDLTKQPPIFLGVVGIDYGLDSFKAILKAEDDLQSNLTHAVYQSIRSLVVISTAKCHVFNLTQCQIESYRRGVTIETQSICPNNCSQKQIIRTEEQVCSLISNRSMDLWINTENEGKPYPDRVCCSNGDDKPSNTCISDSAPRPDSTPATVSPKSNKKSSSNETNSRPSNNSGDSNGKNKEITTSSTERSDIDDPNVTNDFDNSIRSSTLMKILIPLSFLFALQAFIYMRKRSKPIQNQSTSPNENVHPPMKNPAYSEQESTRHYSEFEINTDAEVNITTAEASTVDEKDEKAIQGTNEANEAEQEVVTGVYDYIVALFS